MLGRIIPPEMCYGGYATFVAACKQCSELVCQAQDAVVGTRARHGWVDQLLADD
jgi:hypothetical protein